MAVTVLVTVFSSNLALGVTVGVLLSGVFFASKVGRLLTVETEVDAGGGQLTYGVSGQAFFASADVFIGAFDIEEANEKTVVIDLS